MSLQISATISTQDKHDYDVTSLIFVKGKLYSASDDGKIKVWMPDLRLEHEIVAHPSSVYSLTTDGESLIYSCSNDGTVKSWSLDKLEERGALLTSEREFWKLFWDQGCLYIVNDQGTIYVVKDGKTTGQIEMLEQIKDLVVMDRMIFTSRDLDLTIAQQVGGKSNTITCKTLCGRAPLCVAGDKLCYSSRDGRNILINYNSQDKQFKEITEIKDGHEKLINAVVAKVVNGNTHLYSAGWDCIVKQWLVTDDGYKPGSSCTLPTYINVMCLGNEGKHIFVAGGDGLIWRLDS